MKEDCWAGLPLCMHEMRNSYETLVANSKNKRSLGRPGCRWQVNVKIYIYMHESRKWGCGLDAASFGCDPVAECFELGKEPLENIRIDKQHVFYLMKLGYMWSFFYYFFFNLRLLVTTRASPYRYSTGYLQRLLQLIPFTNLPLMY